MSPDPPNRDDAEGGTMTRSYIGVIVVEVVVLLGLWVFQRYFG